jgi:hypothetical protein
MDMSHRMHKRYEKCMSMSCLLFNSTRFSKNLSYLYVVNLSCFLMTKHEHILNFV